MKKKTKLFLILLTILGIFWSGKSVNAEPAYKTYIESYAGVHNAQSAYEATSVITNDQFKKIEDIYLLNDTLFVVDSGTKAIVQVDLQGNTRQVIKLPVFSQPTGIAFDQQKNMYVADVGAEKVFKLSPTGKLLQEYNKPTEPLFGKKEVFKPKKIKVDIRGNLYIVGEGATNGIIQLNKAGNFLGYFGANMTEESAFKRFQQYILSEVRIGNHLLNVPATPANLDIDGKGIIYTVTSVEQAQAIKKLNVAGANMLSDATPTIKNGIDIKVGPLNNFFVLTSDGLINEFSSTGERLFTFGSEGVDAQRLGIYKNPSAIAIAPDGILYVADGEEGMIHQLQPTDFADVVHSGLTLFEEGRYLDSKEYWEKVVTMNNYFSLGHNAMGQAFLREQQYEKAEKAFKLANNRSGYSTAFWEIRNHWMQTNLAIYLVILISLFIVWKLLKFTDKKTGFLSRLAIKEKMQKIKLFRELSLVFHMVRHPLDTFYQIKKENKASMKSATILLIFITAEFIAFLYGTSYIFNQQLTKQYNLFLLIAIFLGSILLFIGVNYLVATISDGEGSFKQVYMGALYSLAPLIIGWLPVVILSNVLTLNEAFLFHYSLTVMIVWSVVLLILMIKEIHNFTFAETVKNTLLTLFTLIIMVSVAYILYILTMQVVNFVYEIIQEVIFRD